MKSEKTKARDVLVDAVIKHVLPQFRTHGFLELPRPKEPIPMWDFHRARADFGYDVISIIFDNKRRPRFDGAINTIGAEGIRQPWGEFIEASQATAFHPLTRVMILKRRHGVIATILPFWFSHDWFGFRPDENAEANQSAAMRTCEEFVACLKQTERWWTSRELGPNLVPAEVGFTLKKEKGGL